MSERRCKNCLSTDLRESKPIWFWDHALFSRIFRPVRCHHCMIRQYVPGSVLVNSLVSTFYRIDHGINQLHPDAIRDLLDHHEWFLDHQAQQQTDEEEQTAGDVQQLTQGL